MSLWHYAQHSRIQYPSLWSQNMGENIWDSAQQHFVRYGALICDQQAVVVAWHLYK